MLLEKISRILKYKLQIAEDSEMNRESVDVCLASPWTGARAGAVSGGVFWKGLETWGGDTPMNISILLMRKLRHRKLRKMPKDTHKWWS